MGNNMGNCLVYLGQMVQKFKRKLGPDLSTVFCHFTVIALKEKKA